MDGFINLDKPPGATSHDAVAMVRRALNRVKTGHTGTLDPDATGVLPICIGKATRLAEYITGLPKVYRGELKFGVTTTSQDATGDFLEIKDASYLTLEQIKACLPSFRGEIWQVPPMVSAVKKDGKRLYQLARQGQVVEREPRQVTIYRFDLLQFQPGEQPRATFEIACSRGTYIRTLFHDLGQSLGCGGHLSALRRLQVGPFNVRDAITIEQIRERVAASDFSFLQPMTLGVAHLPAVVLPKNLQEKALHGMLLPEVALPNEAGSIFRVMTSEGTLLGMGSFGVGGLHLDKVLATR